MTLGHGRHTHAAGITRRELVQVGYSALLSMSLPGIVARQAAANPAIRSRAKSVVFVFQTGAPSHIDTFDKIAAYPATRGYYPSDLGATIDTALGLDPSSTPRDVLGRPLQLNRGAPIAPLYSASAV